MVVVVPPMCIVVVVVGMQGTVVGMGTFGSGGRHAGSVVDVVELVGPLPNVVFVVGGGAAVVVVADTTVVVVAGDVVGGVVPGGGVEHPSACSSEVKMPATPGNAPNETCNERTSWQTGSPKAPPIWATPTGLRRVWDRATAGWPTTRPPHSASNHTRCRRRRGEPALSPIPVMPVLPRHSADRTLPSAAGLEPLTPRLADAASGNR